MAFVQQVNGETTITLSSPPQSIDFKPEKSSMLLVNISADSLPLKDDFGSMFVNRGIIPRENFEVLKAADHITKADMHKAFMNQITKADSKGVFIFSYTGPAVKLDTDYSLQLSDFNSDNPVTHVTPTTIQEWLSEASTTLGYALFVLDCSFAREMASALTDVKKATVPPNTQLFAVGTELGEARAMFLGTLGGQSIFQYFLDWALRHAQFTPGNLPLTPILTKASTCTSALSSLIVTYDPHQRILRPSTVEPQLKFINRLLADTHGLKVGEDQTDSYRGLDFLFQHFDRSKSVMNLDLKVTQWLYIISDVANESNPLKQLFANGVLTDSVLLTVICSLMYSIASIQVAQGKAHSVSEPNLFVIAFVQTISTIDIVKRDIRDSDFDLIEACKRSWEFYHHVVTKNNLNDKKLRDLFHKIESASKKIA